MFRHILLVGVGMFASKEPLKRLIGSGKLQSNGASGVVQVIGTLVNLRPEYEGNPQRGLKRIGGAGSV